MEKSLCVKLQHLILFVVANFNYSENVTLIKNEAHLHLINQADPNAVKEQRVIDLRAGLLQTAF